ncbi:DUF7710 domain-containing protein [Rohdeia mirabilis]|uniref:DUF7710 domain-containing protein n=1 Tax=Rohdeia mirabilis TaxID=2528008 RepID=UPI003AF38C65
MPEPATVWIFHGDGARFAGGVFTTEASAREWISGNRLNGVLTEYPLDVGVFHWAIREGLTNMKPETLAAKRDDPRFIGGFTTASQRHVHFVDGSAN